MTRPQNVDQRITILFVAVGANRKKHVVQHFSTTFFCTKSQSYFLGHWKVEIIQRRSLVNWKKMQIKLRIWFWWRNWKCVILLFSPAGSKYGFGGVQRQIFVLPTSQSYFASQHCSNIFCSYFLFQLLLTKRPQLSSLSRPLDNNGEPSSIWPEHKTHQRWGGHLKKSRLGTSGCIESHELDDHECLLWHRGFGPSERVKSGLLSCRTLAHL